MPPIPIAASRAPGSQPRASWAQRDEIVTSIQAHPCNPATAAAAGFKVVTLMLEENGYPSLGAEGRRL